MRHRCCICLTRSPCNGQQQPARFGSPPHLWWSSKPPCNSVYSGAAKPLLKSVRKHVRFGAPSS